jgi:hypothetical protein
MKKSHVGKIKKALREYTRKVTKSPEAALKALKDMGILDSDGKLSKNYGGKSGALTQSDEVKKAVAAASNTDYTDELNQTFDKIMRRLDSIELAITERYKK